jgi:hypothetical protein
MRRFARIANTHYASAKTDYERSRELRQAADHGENGLHIQSLVFRQDFRFNAH